jgi:hypothetical protein
MTQDQNQGPDNLNWMEIAESDAINEPRPKSKRLPFLAAAVSLLVIGGGAVFAQISDESPAQATDNVEVVSTAIPEVTQLPTSAPAVASTAAPTIPNVNPGIGRPEHEEREDHGWFRDHDDRDHDDRDHDDRDHDDHDGFREDDDDH